MVVVVVVGMSFVGSVVGGSLLWMFGKAKVEKVLVVAENIVVRRLAVGPTGHACETRPGFEPGIF